ncbi:MAG: YifB family Mg chelatase-like AAA ATPase [Acidobacteriota bacterium]|nr:YifB family Mg chelatase-like AAA ATPase [Acidobacteriota bacterium]
MLSKVWSAATLGIDAVRIVIEVDARQAHQPGFTLVGLPDAAVRESYSRVHSALANCGFHLPCRHITVNLSPADVRKEGSGFDLPIAIGMLHALEVLREEDVAGRVFVGELSLDGALTSVRGTLAISAAIAGDASVRELIVPAPNANEAAAVQRLRVIGAPHLLALLAHLRGTQPLAAAASIASEMFADDADFSEVRGQLQAKRALEVAAAGGHNVMMIGPPGSGKTMLAKRLPSILPRLSDDEAIVTTKIHSVAGVLPAGSGLLARRPFRSPHHTISTAGMAGGGQPLRPGEVSLAHHGVLFLDELPEFRRETLEVMRQPMEDGAVTLARAQRTLTFPARFTLAASLNPCPCGHFQDPRRPCTCTSGQISRYLAKISGPLLDRIDLQVEVAALTTDEIGSVEAGESSACIRARVEAAREIQRERFAGQTIRCNAEMTTRHLRRACELDASSRRLLMTAIDRLGLSARAHDRILKVARTIADLAGSERIDSGHVAEAVQYRALDRGYFV